LTFGFDSIFFGEAEAEQQVAAPILSRV